MLSWSVAKGGAAQKDFPDHPIQYNRRSWVCRRNRVGQFLLFDIVLKWEDPSLQDYLDRPAF